MNVSKRTQTEYTITVDGPDYDQLINALNYAYLYVRDTVPHPGNTRFEALRIQLLDGR